MVVSYTYISVDLDTCLLTYCFFSILFIYFFNFVYIVYLIIYVKVGSCDYFSLSSRTGLVNILNGDSFWID